MTSEVDARIASVFRRAHGQAVATLVRYLGDVALAEDAVQDAFTKAVEKWPVEGEPPNPAGWIITTARRGAVDVLRRTSRGRELESEVVALESRLAETLEEWEETGPVDDDQLRLIFVCCHPALKTEHRVALTLRLLGGLGVDEVARSFLVTEATMAKRLVRAKHKIKAANIPFRLPRTEDLEERLFAVLSVLYLIYNAGLEREDGTALREESIRLSRELARLMPGESEALGLLALLLLNEARSPARWVDGYSILLQDQDRSRWDRSMVDEGLALVRSCVTMGQPGPFQVQASIQAVHSVAPGFESTDWERIVDSYDLLYEMMPTPVVALNRAIAIGEARGPQHGLEAINTVESSLETYHLMHAARGAALRKLGRSDEASEAYRRAAQLASKRSDREFLLEEARSPKT